MIINKKVKGVITSIYRQVSTQVKDSVFRYAVGISFLVWLLYSLSGTFTTIVNIPFEIKGALMDSDFGEKNNDSYEVDCKVSGSGFYILRQMLFPRIDVNTADLKIDYTDDGLYIVDLSTLEKAINNKLPRLNVLNMYSQPISFYSYERVSKRVPVELDIDIDSYGQFMQVKSVIINPAEVLITGEAELIEGIQSIKSAYLPIESNQKSTSGEVRLMPIADITTSEERVYYNVEFERIVEKKVTKYVEIRNSKGVNYSVIPNSVEVTFNVPEDIYNEFNPKNFPIYIDLEHRENRGANSYYLGKNRFVIERSKLPRGVSIRSISPRYVTIVKGNIDAGHNAQEYNLNKEKINNILDKR